GRRSGCAPLGHRATQPRPVRRNASSGYSPPGPQTSGWRSRSRTGRLGQRAGTEFLVDEAGHATGRRWLVEARRTERVQEPAPRCHGRQRRPPRDDVPPVEEQGVLLRLAEAPAGTPRQFAAVADDDV